MNKSTIVAILIFAALALTVATTLEEAPQRGVTKLSLGGVTPQSVDALLIGDDDGIRIERDGEDWKLDGKLADAKVVDRVVESVTGIESSDLASRNPERYGELEVDDEKGSRVRLFEAGETVADLVVGAAASGGSYVRSGEEVYVVPGIYRASLTRGRAGWLERRAFFDEIDDVERVEVAVGGGTPYALVRKDRDWLLEDPSVLPAGYRFDPSLAGRLVRSLVTLRADDILDEDPEPALGDDADRLSFRVAGDEEMRTLRLGPVADASVIAKSSSRAPYISLRETVATGLRKSLADLRDFRIADLDSSRAARLVLDFGEDTLTLEKGDGGWTLAETSIELPEDFELDPAAVTRRLGVIQQAKAIGEADPKRTIDRSNAARSIAVTLDDGSEVVLAFGDGFEREEETVYPAVGNFDERTYIVDQAALDRLFGGIESFEKVAPALPQNGLGNIDPEALKNLPPEVRDSLLKQMAEQAAMQRAMQAAGQ